MRKNGSRLISLQQYRLTDLFIFLVIAAIAELTVFFAAKWFPNEAIYTFSFMVPITLIVMVRWGPFAAVYAVFSAVLYCALNQTAGIYYAVYIFGNLFVMLMLVPLKIFGGERINKTWYSAAAFVIGGWACVYLGRSAAWAVCWAIAPQAGTTAAYGFTFFAVTELLSLAMAIIIIMVIRRLDGLYEDQKHYLLRLDAERKEKMRRDNFGDEPIDIDEESLSILRKRDDDLY